MCNSLWKDSLKEPVEAGIQVSTTIIIPKTPEEFSKVTCSLGEIEQGRLHICPSPEASLYKNLWTLLRNYPVKITKKGELLSEKLGFDLVFGIITDIF